MRLRLDEILAERDMTAYRLAKLTGLSLTAVYKLAKDQWRALPRDVLDALCDALDVEPGELLVRERTKRRR